MAWLVITAKAKAKIKNALKEEGKNICRGQGNPAKYFSN